VRSSAAGTFARRVTLAPGRDASPGPRPVLARGSGGTWAMAMFVVRGADARGASWERATASPSAPAASGSPAVAATAITGAAPAATPRPSPTGGAPAPAATAADPGASPGPAGDPAAAPTGGTATPAPTAPPVATPTASPSPVAGEGDGCAGSVAPAAERHLVALLNRHRAAAGAPPLAPNPRLTEAARGHSCDMAARGLLSHRGSDGSTPDRRIRAAGVDAGRTGENIGLFEADTVAAGVDRVDAWLMAEPGHRATILDPTYAQIGVGVADIAGQVWVTEDFAGLPGTGAS